MRQLLEIDIDVYSIRLTRHCVVYAFTIQPRRVAPDERTSARKQDQISIGPWSTSSIDPLLFAGRRERFHPRHFPLSFLFTQRTRNNNQINKRRGLRIYTRWIWSSTVEWVGWKSSNFFFGWRRIAHSAPRDLSEKKAQWRTRSALGARESQLKNWAIARWRQTFPDLTLNILTWVFHTRRGPGI